MDPVAIPQGFFLVRKKSPFLIIKQPRFLHVTNIVNDLPMPTAWDESLIWLGKNISLKKKHPTFLVIGQQTL